jgi:cytochrome c biogenesis protein CcmG/thiol:disulfide interchange protein DsbE
VTPLAVFLAAAFVLVTAVGAMHVLRQAAQPLTDGPAPDFSLAMHDGTTFTLSEHRGQWVVVNFWGSWCLGCRVEAPELQQVWAKYRDHGVTVVGVGFRDAAPNALAFIDEFGLTFPNGHDDSLTVTRQFGITGAPETYIIDPEGTIRAISIGQFTDGWLDATMAEMLGVEPSGGA